MITSKQNARIKQVCALQTQARTRRKSGLIVLEGLRLVRDAVRAGYTPEYLLYTPQQVEIESFVDEQPGTALAVDEVVMRHMSDTRQPQGLIGVFPLPSPTLPENPKRVLILDGIGDPGNLGTMLRTAAAAGVQAVLLSPDCVDAFNPKALRAGMGAHFRVVLADRGWPEIRAYCGGLRGYLADSGGGLRYDEVDWSQPWALIIGSEAHGAGREAQQMAVNRVYIPMAAGTESINAAAAAAVLLFEAAKHPCTAC